MDQGDETGSMVPEGRGPKDALVDPGLVLAFAPDGANAPPVLLLLGRSDSITVGREPAPDTLVIPLSSISRRHARLWREGARCFVEDLGSRNGVLVRGHRVERAELRPGDDVRIGDTVFVLVPRGASLHHHTRFDGAGEEPYPHASVAGGPLTRRIFEALTPIAQANIPVLVHGETGTGKELVAQAVHAASGRRGALRAVNCAAIPPTLVESELFGVKRGAFTGADRDSPGIVRAAHGGTLFLDEIGDLPLEIQPKLLRLLESNEISPVGAMRTEQVDVRVVCATHANLEELVEAKRFRADLHSRIRGHVVTLPPLRERKTDMARLVNALLARLGRPGTKMSVAFMLALLRYDWPYNVRELFTVLRRAVAIAAPGERLETSHLPPELLEPVEAPGPAPVRAAAAEPDPERPAVPTAEELRAALVEHGGNVAALARVFRRDRSLVHRWLKQHGLEPDAFRKPPGA